MRHSGKLYSQCTVANPRQAPYHHRQQSVEIRSISLLSSFQDRKQQILTLTIALSNKVTESVFLTLLRWRKQMTLCWQLSPLSNPTPYTWCHPYHVVNILKSEMMLQMYEISFMGGAVTSIGLKNNYFRRLVTGSSFVDLITLRGNLNITSIERWRMAIIVPCILLRSADLLIYHTECGTEGNCWYMSLCFLYRWMCCFIVHIYCVITTMIIRHFCTWKVLFELHLLTIREV